MNQEQLNQALALAPGRDLDTVVARFVLGWHADPDWQNLVPRNMPRPWEVFRQQINGDVSWIVEVLPPNAGLLFQGDRPAPAFFSTEVAAAFGLLDRLPLVRYELRGEYPLLPVQQWSYTLICTPDRETDRQVIVNATSLPLAICRAALRVAALMGPVA